VGGPTPKKTVSLVVATRAGAGLSGGLVERPGRGRQRDLVEHHLRHNEHYMAALRPVGLELIGHRPDLVEVSVVMATSSSTLATSI